MSNNTFTKLKSSFNKGIATVSIKTSSSLEKVKLKTHIESLKDEILKRESIVGETVFEIWKEDSSTFPMLKKQLEELMEKQQELEQLVMELNSIDERDKQILGTAEYVQQEENVEEEKYVCPKCNAIYEVPIKFCRKCGQKMILE